MYYNKDEYVETASGNKASIESVEILILMELKDKKNDSFYFR